MTSEAKAFLEKLGAEYFFGRLTELCDADCPWWTRSQGIGIRMRLTELLDLSMAHQAGTVATRALQALQEEARQVLLKEGTYCSRNYPEIAEELRRVFSKPDTASLSPGGLAHAAVSASLGHLGSPDYVDRLISDIDSACGVVAPNLDLQSLDAMTELLYDEQIYEGHSRQWRSEIAVQAKALWKDGKGIGEAVRQSLDDAGFASPTNFDVLVPLHESQPPPAGKAGMLVLTPEEASEIVKHWNQASLFEALGAVGVVRFEDQEAVDFEAAAELADDRFRVEAGLWRLRGGEISRREELLVYDENSHVARLIRLPTEPIDLMPAGMETFEPGKNRPVDDALIQLAQARSASPGAALADLWTAVEILFGGQISDPKYEVARTMGRLARFLVLRDLLSWFGNEFDAAGILPTGTPKALLGATIETIAERTREVLEILEIQERVLARVRLKRLLNWLNGSGLTQQIEDVGNRMERVGARAYLIRNFVVHKGLHARPRALAAALPPFAALVRVCVGYVASTVGEPLTAAELAAMRVSRFGHRVENSEARLPEELIQIVDPSHSP